MPVPFTAVLRLLVVMPLLAAVGGCSAVAGYFMPSDIASMEERTARLATALQRDHPQASQTYVIDGRRMHYVGLLDAAPKPLILFVHGSPGDWTGWADYLADPELAERAQLIAVDRPGFGGSGAGETERSLHQQSRDIGVLLDKAAPGQRVILVGHSFGGPVIARLAMDYPERITDLVILAGSIDPGQEHTAWYQYPADWSLIRWTLPKDLVVCNQDPRPEART